VRNFEPEILSNPLTNRGTAFTTVERDRLGLTGRLPSAVETLDEQADRSYGSAILIWVIDMLKGPRLLMLGASDSPALRFHERTLPDRSNSWDSHMADTIAFLISARASLLELASETSSDPHDEGVLTSVSAKVEEALSALDDLSVANWVQIGCVGSLGDSLARLPIRSLCLDGQVRP
jgi:hypothetical protein